MNRSDFGRMRYNGNINEHHHSSHKTRKNMKAQQYSEDDDESSLHSGLFSNSQTVLILTVVVGCFGVLWPKIFSPMFFGDTYSHQDISDDAGSFGGGSLFPEHPNPAMRARMGAPHPGLAAGHGKPVDRPGAVPVRTIDKEWPDKHPRPGMRPTIGGPGIQPNQKQAAGGGMGVIMPIYTVAILVFFIYTIVKILFKNKNNEEEDEEFLNSEYYKNCIAQNSGKKSTVNSDRTTSSHQQNHQKQKIVDPITKTDKLENNSKESKIVKEGKKTVSFNLEQNHEEPSEEEKCDSEDTPKISETDIDNKKEKIIQECNQKKNAEVDPRDIEIKLLKAKLEQTEKTLETVLAQMANINMPNLKIAKKKKSKKNSDSQNHSAQSEE